MMAIIAKYDVNHIGKTNRKEVIYCLEERHNNLRKSLEIISFFKKGIPIYV